MKNLRKGLKPELDYEYLRGKIDSEGMLEDLGIEVSWRQGAQIMCHCPDHLGNHANGDANPSFGYNEEPLKYNCFVCGGGNVIELVQMQQGGTEEEALRFLESHSDLAATSKDDLVDKLQLIMNPQVERDTLPEYPLDNLFQYKGTHPYLLERGITQEVINEMQVGFDEKHCGITIPHMFMGKLRGWQTRHLAQDKDGNYLCPNESCNEKGRVPKYKNTTDFPKKNTLYNYDQMKEAVKTSGESSVLIVESPFTVLWLKSMGYKQVVATFGSFTREQGMLLIPFQTVYFWPDNDAAGKENTERAIDTLKMYGNLKIVPVVSGEKSDAANLDDWNGIDEHIMNAFPASLYPKFGLATLDQLPNTNRW